MSLLVFEQEILAGGKPRIIRRQHCMGCRHVLALEITEKVATNQSDYYVAIGCEWKKGEPHLIYEHKKWYGNYIKCPVCGREGKLPIDIPLSWELMQETEKNLEEKRKEANAVHS